MIRLTGTGDIAGFIRDLDLAFAQLDRDLSSSFAEWTRKVFTSIVYHTPQWSGDLASNWNYSVGQPNTRYLMAPNKTGDDPQIDHWREGQGVFYMGHPTHVNMALARMALVAPPTWRDVVYVTNATPIAPEVEDHTIKIRPVNLIDGRVAMIQYHVDKFNRGGLGP